MPGLISLRLPEDLLEDLEREADRSGQSRSEIVRDAVDRYLHQQKRDRFLKELARAARARGPYEAQEMAAEALPLDNEATGVVDASAVREPRARYRTRKKPR